MSPHESQPPVGWRVYPYLPILGSPILIRWPDKWKEGKVRGVDRKSKIVTVEFENGGIMDVEIGAYALPVQPDEEVSVDGDS